MKVQGLNVVFNLKIIFKKNLIIEKGKICVISIFFDEQTNNVTKCKFFSLKTQKPKYNRKGPNHKTTKFVQGNKSSIQNSRDKKT